MYGALRKSRGFRSPSFPSGRAGTRPFSRRAFRPRASCLFWNEAMPLPLLCHPCYNPGTVSGEASTKDLGSEPVLVAVVGPTAVGKTAVGIALAERLNGEIISADAVAVYRGLNIGSTKPDAAERQ